VKYAVFCNWQELTINWFFHSKKKKLRYSVDFLSEKQERAFIWKTLGEYVFY